MRPMQTMACILDPRHFESLGELDEALYALEERGYNTIAIPVLIEGTLLFRASRQGHLRGETCRGRDVLVLLKEYDFTVWLMADPLTAGSRMSGELGDLAARHRDWLMKNHKGRYEIGVRKPVPGLFCWTSLNYRRFLGNLLVEVIEGYPVDGLLVDLRNLPHTTEEPATWSHLGFSCLRRIEEELGLNLEKLLTQPTLEEFRGVEEWRINELISFLVNIKARAQKSRPDIPFSIIADLGNPNEPFAPWARGLAKGMIDEVAIVVEPETAEKCARALDKTANDPRPFMLAVNLERDVQALEKPLAKLPATGFLTLTPEVDSEITLPPCPLQWEMQGALESAPVTASLRLIRSLFQQLDPTDPITLFFMELQDYLSADPEEMHYKDILRVREEVNVLKRRIAGEETETQANRDEIIRQLDLVSRLLLLTPPPSIESI